MEDKGEVEMVQTEGDSTGESGDSGTVLFETNVGKSDVVFQAMYA